MRKNDILKGSNDELNILFISTFDVRKSVYATALLAKILLVYPRSKITLSTGFFSASLFSCFSDRVRIKAGNKPFSLRYFAPLLKEKWDLVVNLEPSYSFLLKLLRGGQYVDLSGIGYGLKDSNPVEFIGEKVGISNLSPEIPLADEFVAGAEKRLYKKQNVIAVAPFTDSGQPIIPLPELLSLIKLLTMAGGIFPASPVAVLGFEGIRKRLGEELLCHLPDWQRVNLVGSLGLLSITAVLNKCRFYIGGDSVISHLAAVNNVASWIAEAENSPKVWGRYAYGFDVKDTSVNKIASEIDDIWHGKLQQ